VAAIWAGVVGLAGAGIGGAAAVWGSYIAGRRAVQAATEQAARTARAEHEHWQRGQRFEAYEELLSAAEVLVNWGGIVPWEDARLGIERVDRAVRRVCLLGPDEAADASTLFYRPMAEAQMSWPESAMTDPCPTPPGRPVDVAGYPDLRWRAHRDNFKAAFMVFSGVARRVLDAPPT